MYSNGTSKFLQDKVGTPLITLGLNVSVVDGPDAYSRSLSATLLDLALTSGTWANPTTKKIIIIAMFGTINSGNFIIGASGAAQTADGLRVNRNSVTAFDFSTLLTATATAPISVASAAMTAMRLTPGASINSIQTDASAVTINTASVLTIPPTIDGLSNLITLTGSVPYWGALVLHCNNVPTDQAIAEAMTFMRPKWLAGNFVLAPTMLGWS